MGKPDIQLCPLGSGSKGNSTFVGTPHGGLLVDAGFSAKQTLIRLEKAGISPARVKAILVTHEHSDHIAGVGPLARKLKLPVYGTRGTMRHPRLDRLPETIFVEAGKRFNVGEIEVEPIPLPHDALEPVAYAMEWGGRRWAVVTDFGYPTRLIVERIRRCDLLVLEANHDEEMLMTGPYPWPLKTRVRGRMGHLSNHQSVSIVEEVIHPGLKGIVLAHLSEVNNRPDLPFALTRRTLDRMGAGDISLSVARQDGPIEGLCSSAL